MITELKIQFNRFYFNLSKNEFLHRKCKKDNRKGIITEPKLKYVLIKIKRLLRKAHCGKNTTSG